MDVVTPPLLVCYASCVMISVGVVCCFQRQYHSDSRSAEIGVSSAFALYYVFKSTRLAEFAFLYLMLIRGYMRNET